MIALIVVQLTGVGAAYFGYPAYAAMAHKLDVYAGIALFSAYTAYDTHKAI